jgi:hypothetical protein
LTSPKGDKRTTEDWDARQNKVISAAPEERCIVDAGPGTGKTAVACKRVAWLTREGGLTPGKIWIVSFTRTAVREIRNRISRYLDNREDAESVRIATLDSHAWMIHSGYDPKANLLGSYDENIEGLTRLVQENADVTEYLQTDFEHLIIDEAQDIVGKRADLLIEIIRKLPDSCGVTVFADEAQAIYGFAIDEDSIGSDQCQLTLPEKIRESFDGKFRSCSLKKVYRTKEPNLHSLFTSTREKVLKPTDDVGVKLQNIKVEVRTLAHGEVPRDIENIDFEAYGECFILCRSRAEVLLRSSMSFKTQQHRIRMSGLPQCISPWIGVCLSEFTGSKLSEKEFSDLWKQKIGTSKPALKFAESSWHLLVMYGGVTKTLVDMHRLRQRLGRGQPPADMASADIGNKGPIIGTIHACKGREADMVCLMIPGEPGQDTDFEEEARVVFVGATRARLKLDVGHGYKHHYAGRLEHGRTYSLFTKNHSPTAMIEIGHEGDISATSMAGREYYHDAETIHSVQKRLLSLAGRITPAVAISDHGAGHIYRLKSGETGEGEDIGCLSKEALSGDLFEIGKEIKNVIGGRDRRPPDEIKYLRVFGIRTIVLPPDSPDCEKLYDPWAKSGIIIAPVVLGYSKAFFRYY